MEPLNIQIDKLNDQQRDAVLNTSGPVLVIAGAGSGKTRVLTTRIALLMEKGIYPERILALTFTKKAAEEMKSRIAESQGEKALRLNMGTFHSVLAKFLREYIYKLGINSNFSILDEEDSKSCLKKCINAVVAPEISAKEDRTKEEEENLKKILKAYPIQKIKAIISAAKNELITADMYASSPTQQELDNIRKIPLMGKIFIEYRNACLRANALDFDDILLYTDMILYNFPEIRQETEARYDYILVDEYQDTNTAQYAILNKLTRRNKNICVVGDDSQSIYAFRSAKIENILNFKNDYPNAKVIKLETNYRSSGIIVDAANRLIAHNETRIPKTCISNKNSGKSIILHECKNENTEGLYVANIIRNMVRYDGMKYSDFAVLYRTNAQSRALEDAMIQKQVPYIIYSGTNFFDRMEVKDLTAYFRLSINPDDDEAFLRVINKPVRGIGSNAQEKLSTLARSLNLSLWKTINSPYMLHSGLKPRVIEGIGRFKTLLNEMIEISSSSTASAAANDILELTGFIKAYNEENTKEASDRAGNLMELISSVQSYEEELERKNEAATNGEREESTMTGYLQSISLLTSADTDDSSNKVNMMTVHSAKGLEFDTVFVTGMEQGLFPLESEKTLQELEEERRLFYVAVTRAKDSLYVTNASQRMKFGRRSRMKRSQFINELTTSVEDESKE